MLFIGLVFCLSLSEEGVLRRDVVAISRRCGLQGWCPGTLGNISVLNRKGNFVYIKRSGVDLNVLELSDILVLDLEGKVLLGEGGPSKEVGFHLGIYKIRLDVGCVFHIHPSYATAFAVAGKKLPMVTEAAKIVLVDVPLVESAPPGSEELASNVIEGFRDPNVKAILIKEHGVVAVGSDLKDTFSIASLVEDTAKVAFLSSQIK